MLLRSNFSSFPHYFIYIFLTSGVKINIHLLNVVVQFIVFLTLSTLICRRTDISKCFSESLGIRDNESRLYFMFQVDTDSQVPYKQAMAVSNRVGAVCYVECSSLSGDGIQDLIKETVETVEKTVECTNKNRSCCSCNIL